MQLDNSKSCGCVVTRVTVTQPALCVHAFIMSDVYNIRPGGSLKLKGVAEGGVTKKKKKSKSKSSKTDAELSAEQERNRVKQLLLEEGSAGESSGSSSRRSPIPGGSSSRKTEAERRFEEAQKRRLAEKVAKLAKTTHKDRVSEFNAKLESLSEHHDIPKVGPG